MKRSTVLVITISATLVLFVSGIVGAGAPPAPIGNAGGSPFGSQPANQFPPNNALQDHALDVIGFMGIDVLACGAPFVSEFVGRANVRFPTAAATDAGSTVIDIQIVSLSLTGAAPITVGCGGPHLFEIALGPDGGGGELRDPTNQPAGAFPAGLELEPQLEFQIPGLPVLRTDSQVQVEGLTTRWPPVDVLLQPDPSFPSDAALEDLSMVQQGELTNLTLLPVTPATAFMKGEMLRHETETIEGQGDLEEAIDDALNALLGGLAPLPPAIDQNEMKIDDVKLFLEQMQEAIEAIAGQTRKVTKKVNKVRKLVKALD